MGKLSIINNVSSDLRAGLAEVAHRRSGIPHIDMQSVLRIDVMDAWKALRPFFPLIAAYATPKAMARSLLSQNGKLAKTARGLFRTTGLTLLPANYIVGIDLCVARSPACFKLCLKGSGHNAVPINEQTKLARLMALLVETDCFMRMLVYAIELLPKHYRVRLNVLSDIPWELVCPELFEMFSDRQFYDYTKVTGRRPPSNYHLVMSFSGQNWNACKDYLGQGGSVAIVGKTQRGLMPGTTLHVDGKEYAVINGDEHDVRSEDPANCIVWLKYKPTAGNPGKRDENFIWENFVS